jgi:hypothetical protein
MLYYKDLTDNVVYGYDETEESQLPYIEKAIENGWVDISENYPLPPEPTSAEENKAKASALLANTDWTTIADVADPANSPYLANQAEFISYRNLVRQIAVNPIDGDIDFPIKPSCLWVCNK